MTLHKEAPTVRVYVNGREDARWQCLDVSLGSGADALPRATLEVQPPLTRPGRRKLDNVQLARFPQDTIEVTIGDTVVHYGKVFAQPSTMTGRTGDRVLCVSRMDEHLFGFPLILTYYYSEEFRSDQFARLPTVFNPEIDGVVKPNKSSQFHSRFRYSLFIHEGSTETELGAAYNRGFFGLENLWDLPSAVHYLCWTLNEEQLHVKNPSLGELRAVLPADTSLLRNYTCQFGKYLPDQLDAILNPFGFGWTVDFKARGNRTIRVFERGRGETFALPLQPSGAELNMTASKTEELSLNPDVSSRAFNFAIVYGDFIQYESTFELYRAWPQTYDERDLADLEKNAEAWLTNKILPNVWRKWVLNEAGDYNATRDEIPDRPFDLRREFGGIWLSRRRRFEPCLTLNDDGSPQGGAGGVFVEWYDVTAGEWYPVDMIGPEGRQIRVLQKECGIYFDGTLPPLEMMLQGSGAKLRVTATVSSDDRLVQSSDKSGRGESLIKDAKYEAFDTKTRFKMRVRSRSSRFSGTPYRTSEVDDTEAAKRLAEQLVTSWNRANLDGTVTLTGVEFDPKETIGYTVSGIPGRRVDFNVAPEGRIYPTVVGMRLRIESQQTDLTLDTFRGERI